MTATRQILWRWVIALFFIVAGANHFINPAPYLSMMPAYLPAPSTLVWVSGGAEILGGVGLILASTRAFAGWGLILLLLAIFPANLNVALHGWPGVTLPAWTLWARLPLQFLFIWWVYKTSIAPPPKT